MTNKQTKHINIARIDQESRNNHGWFVRVSYVGKSYSKFFADKKNKGIEPALQAAIAWRNATEEKLGKTRTDRRQVTVSRTNTGIVGVRLNKKLNRYEVSWANIDGSPGKASVSINKYGKKEAFKKACEIRKSKDQIRLESTVV